MLTAYAVEQYYTAANCNVSLMLIGMEPEPSKISGHLTTNSIIEPKEDKIYRAIGLLWYSAQSIDMKMSLLS